MAQVKPSMAYKITQRMLRSAQLPGTRAVPATVCRCQYPVGLSNRNGAKGQCFTVVCQRCLLVIDDTPR